MRPDAGKFVLIGLFSVLIGGNVSAIPYQWEGKAGESSFTLDIPDNWRTWEAVKRNGVIAQFRKGKARIEVRSFAGKEQLTIPQIVGQKAARLSSEFSYVRLIEEKESRFRENLHLSAWEVRSHGKIYREETAIVLGDSGPVVVSCFIPSDEYAVFRTHCENAFYSIFLDAESKGEGTEKKRPKVDLMAELAKLYFVNVPGNLPVIAPDLLMGTGQGPDKPAQIQYDENYILPDENNK